MLEAISMVQTLHDDNSKARLSSAIWLYEDVMPLLQRKTWLAESGSFRMISRQIVMKAKRAFL